MTEKEYRLSKVAAELNNSFAVLVQHLQKKGFQIENKPTAKISEEMYQVLLAEFRQDKAVREESKLIDNRLKTKADDKAVPPSMKTLIKTLPRKEKEITPPPAAEPTPEPIPEPTPEPTPEPPAVPVVPEKEIPAPLTPEPEPLPEPEVKPQPETKTREDLPELKVLGRIELPEINKGKSDDFKKKKKDRPAPAAEIKPKEKIQEPKPEPVKPVEVKTPSAPTVVNPPKPAPEPEPEPEKIETRFEKISGLNIKGKIDLPAEPVKKPASDADNKGKRPRKKLGAEKVRLDKVRDPNAPNQQPRTNPEQKVISQDTVRKNIGSTMRGISNAGRGRGVKDKYKRDKRERIRNEQESQDARRQLESKILKVTEFISANELASMMNVSVQQVITACFSLGLMVSINQRLDAEIIQLLANEFGFEVEFVDADTQIEIEEETDRPEDLKPRPPIVTVMGHVDHGKTSLLDYVRKTNVIAGEAGGITQHIGAYEVTLPDQRKITFLDTPGHEAFTAMRARGAKVTDIAIIVIAADDSVMPQTREAISHAQAAGVPMVFAINKMDKEGANSDRIREQLSAMNILVEEWGGKYQCQEVSAKKGINMDKLLEKVLLEAEMLELKANPDRLAKGTVVEATLEKGRGVVCSILIQTGTLKVGDNVVAGPYYGRVKALFNERGQRVESAPPSTPVKMLGFSETPTAGDQFIVLAEEADAKDLANKRFQLVREQ
ncbi:MAG: translation initiation factor IF-2, partial [Bacteroidetes bacterium]|nr:translation initiation factor IF-2 [Bacteroidota bacterium]